MLPIVALIHRNNRRRRENRALIQMRRTIRETYDPFKLPDARFIELFRLSKPLAQELIDMLKPHLHRPSTVKGIQQDQKVLVALRFYATGSYQRGLGEEYNFGISQSAVHFIIREVTNAMNNIVDNFVQFPLTRNARNTIKTQFFQKFGFPGCVGAIDGTHVAILKPSQDDEHNFYNRKGKI